MFKTKVSSTQLGSQEKCGKRINDPECPSIEADETMASPDLSSKKFQ
jgi:hypothetical protein